MKLMVCILLVCQPPMTRELAPGFCFVVSFVLVFVFPSLLTFYLDSRRETNCDTVSWHTNMQMRCPHVVSFRRCLFTPHWKSVTQWHIPDIAWLYEFQATTLIISHASATTRFATPSKPRSLRRLPLACFPHAGSRCQNWYPYMHVLVP